MESTFYVYVLFRLDGRPCYVGKGSGKRWQHHNRYTARNQHLSRIIVKAGRPLPAVIVREDMTESDAFALEVALISAIGRCINGGPLANMTDGGEGQKNPSQETRAKIKAARKLQKINHSAETRRKISSSNMGRPVSAHQMEALRIANTDRPVSELQRAAFELNRKRRWSDEARASLSAQFKGRTYSAETIAKMSASAKMRRSSAETRAKISAALTGRPCSPETRAKIGDANRGKRRSSLIGP